jgi:predicted RNase H-like HicB family nuclease
MAETVAGRRLAVTYDEIPGKGWVVHAWEIRATAQGRTKDAALANLRELVKTYPEILEPPPRPVEDHDPAITAAAIAHTGQPPNIVGSAASTSSSSVVIPTLATSTRNVIEGWPSRSRSTRSSRRIASGSR